MIYMLLLYLANSTTQCYAVILVEYVTLPVESISVTANVLQYISQAALLLPCLIVPYYYSKIWLIYTCPVC